MKTPNLFLLVTFFCFSFSNAQHEPYSHFKTRQYENNWSFGVGVNVVDDSGRQGKHLFDIKENRRYYWAFETPLTLSAEYHFNAEFSLNATAAFNKFRAGKHVDGQIVDSSSSPNYFAFDLSGKYSFKVLLESNVLDPYVSWGVGYVTIQDFYMEPDNTKVSPKTRIVSNPSFGLNIWFSRYWALNMHVMGKLTYTQDTSHLLQYGAGIVYLLKQ